MSESAQPTFPDFLREGAEGQVECESTILAYPLVGNPGQFLRYPSRIDWRAFTGGDNAIVQFTQIRVITRIIDAAQDIGNWRTPNPLDGTTETKGIVIEVLSRPPIRRGTYSRFYFIQLRHAIHITALPAKSTKLTFLRY